MEQLIKKEEFETSLNQTEADEVVLSNDNYPEGCQCPLCTKETSLAHPENCNCDQCKASRLN